MLWSDSSQSWVREENLPKKVLTLIHSGIMYAQRKVNIHEFRQEKNVLKLIEKNEHDGGEDNDMVVKRL